MCSKVLQVPDDYGPRPFCSARCKLADLSNWLDEKYKIPLDESDDTSEEVSRE